MSITLDIPVTGEVMNAELENISDYVKTQTSLLSFMYIVYELRCEKTGLQGFQPGQTHTGLYNHYPCSKNKGADQLRSYRKAGLRLCFRICKNPVFSLRGLYIITA